MTSTRRLPLLPLLLLIAAMFGLAACGDDGNGDTDDTTTTAVDDTSTNDGTDEPLEGDEDAAAALDDAASRSADQTTIEMSILMELDGELINQTDMTTSADGQIGLGLVEVPPFGQVETLIIDEAFYYAFPDLPDGIEWVRMSFDEVREQTGVDPSAGSQDPSEALQLLTSASRDVVEVGEEQLDDGTAVTHYRMTADVGALMEEAAASGALVDGGDAAEMFGEETVMDVFVDDEGLVRLMAYELETTPAAQVPGDVLSYVFEYTYSDEPIDVTVPADDTVISIAELTQAAS